MNDKLISIIMPCYNSASTISKSIDSVSAQSYSNWELIIVDDCSTDRTPDIISQYIKSGLNIKYFRLPSNTGSPVSPRNVGIGASSGDYVSFLDSDDVWLPNKLNIQLDFMEKNECSFTYSPYFINRGGIQTLYTPPVSVGFKQLISLNVIGCLTVMISRDLLGDFRFKHILVEDFELWLRILCEKNILARSCSDAPLAIYNVEQNSRSSNKMKLIKGYFHIFNIFINSKVLSLLHVLRYFYNFFYKYK